MYVNRIAPALAAVIALSACGGGVQIIWPKARKLELNTETTFDIKPGAPIVPFKVMLPGEGTVTVSADPVNQQSKLEVRLYPIGAPQGELALGTGTSPLEVPQVPPGEYYVVCKPMNSVQSKVRLTASFKPKDFDAASGDDRKEDGARELTTSSTGKDSVDALAMDRTDWWVIKTPEAGKLTINFKPSISRGKVTAEVQPPKGGGDNTVIDVRNGFVKEEAPKGEWYIKVSADESGAATYTLDATFEAGDPEANSGDDGRPDGAGEITLKPKAGGNTQVGTAKDEVSYDKRDRSDFWKIDVPDAGKLSVALKLADKSSKVKAEFFRKEPDADDEGEKVKSGFNIDVEKASYWVKVYAPNKGDASKYTLEFEYFPNKFIDAVAVEIDKRSGCAVMVNKGTSQGVRNGVQAQVVQGQQVLATGMVEQAFPALSRIKILSTQDCRFTSGQQVRIQDMGY